MSDADQHRSDQLLGPSPLETGAAAPGRVIVAGGGLAGIAAAMALARCGNHVTLVEAKRRLGGRTGSFVDPRSGEMIDYCQHVGMGCCTNLRQLIDWLGQTEKWRVESTLHFYGSDGKHRQLGALPWLPAPLHLAGWLWSWPDLGWTDRFSIARGMRGIDRLELNQELDHVSAYRWLIEQRQTPTAIDRFWSTVVVSALGEELKRVSLLAVAKVFQDGFLRHRDAFHLLVPQCPLSVLFGSDAEAQLRSIGVKVELSSTVRQLVWFDGQCCGVRLSDGRELSANATILAIPWHRYSAFIGDYSQPELESIIHSAKQLASSPISGVHSWWDRAWLESEHAVLVGRLCQWVFTKKSPSDKNPSDEHYYQIVISASRDFSQYIPHAERDVESKKPLAEREIEPGRTTISDSRSSTGYESQYLLHAIHADLAEVFPKAAKAKLLRVKSITDPLAVFSVEPGANSFRPAVDAIERGVWLAGDWTRTGWPATMEGAVLSGFRAAERVAQALGHAQVFVAKPLG